MPELDLHNVKHEDAAQEIYHFLFIHQAPVKIITGQSYKMRGIVFKCLKELDMTFHYDKWLNLGCLVIQAAK